MSSRITLLEMFGTSSVIMPYYGTTHQSFLFLSKLNIHSREMLDNNFDGFLNWMMKNLVWIIIDDEYRGDMLFLPCSLFKFTIRLNCDALISKFLKFIENINNKTGYYFNNHFMNSRLWVDIIEVKSEDAEKLYSSLKLLEAIEVIDYIMRNDTIIELLNLPLIFYSLNEVIVVIRDYIF